MKIIGENIEMKATVPSSSWFGIGFHNTMVDANLILW